MNEKNNNQEQTTVIPASVAINAFKEELYKAINDCKLHPVVLHMVLKDVFNEVTTTVSSYEQQEIKQYEESLKEDMNEVPEKCNCRKMIDKRMVNYE